MMKKIMILQHIITMLLLMVSIIMSVAMISSNVIVFSSCDYCICIAKYMLFIITVNVTGFKKS